MSSEVIRGHQGPSEVIRDHERAHTSPRWSSEVIRDHHRSLEPIRGHQSARIQVLEGHWQLDVHILASATVFALPAAEEHVKGRTASLLATLALRHPDKHASNDFTISGNQWSSGVISGHH